MWVYTMWNEMKRDDQPNTERSWEIMLYCLLINEIQTG